MVGTLVEKTQNLFDSIGKDTGFDGKYGRFSVLVYCFVKKDVHGIVMLMWVYMLDTILTFKETDEFL
jgi:hypothetical protein